MNGNVPQWLELALADEARGKAEIPGPEENPDIIEAHSYTSLKAKSETVPWCSSQMCEWMEKAGVASTRSAAAASWREWGVELEYGQLGCIVVMRRPGGNHVALYLEESERGVLCLGGNQRDKVCRLWFSWDAITNFRWPV